MFAGRALPALRHPLEAPRRPQGTVGSSRSGIIACFLLLPRRMGISLNPKHLKLYRDLAMLFLKYGNSDAVKSMGLEEALQESDAAGDAANVPEAESLAADLERMGPTFVKLGQLLSTRADLLPIPYVDALTRLQDT